MKVERVFSTTPDRRQQYQKAAALPSVPATPETKTVGVDKVTISSEGKAQAAEWRDEQARRLVRRPGKVTDVENASTEAIEPIKK